MRSLFTVPLLLLLAGCHVYVPVGPGLPAPGAVVRARVSNEASIDLMPQFGPGVTDLSGSLLQGNEKELLLSLESVRTLDRGSFPWTKEQVRLDRQHIVVLERRTLSSSRTVLFIGSLVAGWYLLRQGVSGDAFEPVDRLPPVNPT